MTGPKLHLTLEQAANVFGTTEQMPPKELRGEAFDTRVGVELQFHGTTLGLEYTKESQRDTTIRVLGNTLVQSKEPRGCDVPGVECTLSACGLANVLISNDARRERNCSGANTILGLGGNPRFVITPTNNEVAFMADEDSYAPFVAKDEHGGDQTMFNKVAAASTFVIAERDLPEGVDAVDVMMNGADSALAVTTLEITHPVFGEKMRYALISCSSQPNLGSRGPNEQILAKGVNQILDREGITDAAERARVLAQAVVDIDIGFSATLDTFGHQVKVPKLTIPAELQGKNLSQLTAEERKLLSGSSAMALKLMLKKGIIDPVTHKVTGELLPKDVMEFRYPGALTAGELHKQSNIELGIRDEPYTEEGCPTDGALCMLDYPAITRRTLTGQLYEMGIPPGNIRYDQSRSTDPADVDNGLASRRRFALYSDVPAKRTPRSRNGVTVRFKR